MPINTNLTPRDVPWDVTADHLTTQYKSFYLSFDDNSFGYVQFAYGNLGLFIKVSPLGWTYYPSPEEAPNEPIIGSSTHLFRSMKISKDRFKVTVSGNDFNIDPEAKKCHVTIKGLYDLHIEMEGEGYQVKDFGRTSKVEFMRHRTFPMNKVTGTVTAYGKTKKVTGNAVAVDAMFFRDKFTSFGHTWQNAMLFDREQKHVLTCLHYYTRDQPMSAARSPSQASLTLDGKLVSVMLDNEYYQDECHSPDGLRYELPKTVRRVLSGKTFDGRSVQVKLRAELETIGSITDVLKIFPKWAKDLVSIWAGLPYVFVWLQNMAADVYIDGKHECQLSGAGYVEQTCVHYPPSESEK
ncbi:Svf1 family protein Svf2 [Schizosaccharomyces japonicus yFS275]|uniref:Svf1 family protein Svf2 n=1 Tax=Schizosaccharomyces japonicus (strain yFS275 / FY16936) TaxID=402676 RepID=B6JXN6_SCHJY|nr:Svf1 family protein Svf2 [Schizosaccharomyces japonicus yFS275]EEB05180.1 Svf1 family protein Svf2 [Schizosaccharomyces japonicus yFS275]